MRILMTTVAVIGLQWYASSRAEAQPAPIFWPGWGGYSSSTPAEGFGHGLGDVIRSAGEYNYLTSQAALNWEDAWRQGIDNNIKGTTAYFQGRLNNQAYQASMRRPPNPEMAARYLESMRPKRLTLGDLGVSGDIRWPVALTTDDFAGERQSLETLFVGRADRGSLSPQERVQVEQLVEDMIDRLKAAVREMRPSEYVKAKQFLVGLGTEARIPLQIATRPVRSSRTF